jgi:hypothetical protein
MQPKMPRPLISKPIIKTATSGIVQYPLGIMIAKMR